MSKARCRERMGALHHDVPVMHACVHAYARVGEGARIQSL